MSRNVWDFILPGSEGLHQESSKVFVFSLIGLFVQWAALNPLITDISTIKSVFFHIVNNIENWEKRLFHESLVNISPLAPRGALRTCTGTKIPQTPTIEHPKHKDLPKLFKFQCRFVKEIVRTTWISWQCYFLASWNGFWPF